MPRPPQRLDVLPEGIGARVNFRVLMCRAVQRNLVPRRRNVCHQRQIALVGVLRTDKKGGRDLLPIKDFQNRHGIFARSVIKGQATRQNSRWGCRYRYIHSGTADE